MAIHGNTWQYIVEYIANTGIIHSVRRTGFQPNRYVLVCICVCIGKYCACIGMYVLSILVDTIDTNWSVLSHVLIHRCTHRCQTLYIHNTCSNTYPVDTQYILKYIPSTYSIHSNTYWHQTATSDWYFSCDWTLRSIYTNTDNTYQYLQYVPYIWIHMNTCQYTQYLQIQTVHAILMIQKDTNQYMLIQTIHTIHTIQTYTYKYMSVQTIHTDTNSTCNTDDTDRYISIHTDTNNTYNTYHTYQYKRIHMNTYT